MFHSLAAVITISFVNILVFSTFAMVNAHTLKKPQKCSFRLENALEQVRRRNLQVKSARTIKPETPYTLYHSLYGSTSDYVDSFYENINTGRGSYAKNIHRADRRPETLAINANDETEAADFLRAQEQRHPHKLSISRVAVEDLHVRLPPNAAARWVEVDKCKFSTKNSTLDTRLIFPDLTISGKVVLQPTGGKCNMILRLRRAGIEFHTVPIGFDMSAINEESRRIGVSASVRTDSHFAEPGFISVFAHGCQGPTGIRLRQNSKRRFGFASGNTHTQEQQEQQQPTLNIELSEPQIVLGSASNSNRWGKFHNPYNSIYDVRSASYNMQPYNRLLNAHDLYEIGTNERIDRNSNRYRREVYQQHQNGDQMHFTDDILNITDDLDDLFPPDARTFSELFGSANSNDERNLFSTAAGIEDEAQDALTNELEKLFSMGVRSLLTTYMQRALQPAIKETLMENMGYILSYG